MRRIPESKRGIAVIMAMWLLAVLAIIGSTFAYMMRLEPIIARHQRDEVRAMCVAQAGLDRAYDLLKAGQAILILNEDLTDTEGTVVGTYEVNVAGVFFFTFRGNSDGTDKEFYRYNAYKNEWEPMKPAPGEINSGGALAWGGGGYVYGLRGNSDGTDKEFYRYRLSTNNWKKKDSIPGAVDWGGALAHWYEYDVATTEYSHYLYATRGGGYSDFYLYDIDTNSWIAKANTPEAVYSGGALAWVEESAYSDYIYATRGGSYSNFWMYSISGDSWSSVAWAPDNIGAGGALAYYSDYIYATRGGNYSNFWKYSIPDNSWTAKANTPEAVYSGGSLVWSGRDYLYALRGSNTDEFWRYKISDDEWNPNPGDSPGITGGVPATTPGAIAAGGSLTRAGDLYWIKSIGYVPNKNNPRAKKKIEAIVDTSVTGVVENRIIYWKEIPKE